MEEVRRSKKRKLRELLQDLLENSSDSEISETSQPQGVSDGSEGEDAEMNCPLADLASKQKEPPQNGLLDLLENKLTSQKVGPAVHPDISELISVFLTKGLDSEVRKQTIERYPMLKDCAVLKPPEINPEIKPCLTTAVLRQDAFLSKLQGQLAAALSALAVPLNTTYEAIKNGGKGEKEELEKIGDPLKLIADIFFSLSNHRRYLIIPSLDNSVKDVLENCPVDSLLFGQNFPEKLRTSKDAKKLGASIKKKPKQLRSGPTSIAGPSSSLGQSISRSSGGSTRGSSNFLVNRRTPTRARYKKEGEERKRSGIRYRH